MFRIFMLFAGIKNPCFLLKAISWKVISWKVIFRQIRKNLLRHGLKFIKKIYRRIGNCLMKASNHLKLSH